MVSPQHKMYNTLIYYFITQPPYTFCIRDIYIYIYIILIYTLSANPGNQSP